MKMPTTLWLIAAGLLILRPDIPAEEIVGPAFCLTVLVLWAPWTW